MRKHLFAAALGSVCIWSSHVIANDSGVMFVSPPTSSNLNTGTTTTANANLGITGNTTPTATMTSSSGGVLYRSGGGSHSNSSGAIPGLPQITPSPVPNPQHLTNEAYTRCANGCFAREEACIRQLRPSPSGVPISPLVPPRKGQRAERAAAGTANPSIPKTIQPKPVQSAPDNQGLPWGSEKCIEQRTQCVNRCATQHPPVWGD